MKIAFVVNDIDFLLSHRKALVLKAVQQGWEVFVLSDRSGTAKLPHTIQCYSIPIHRSSFGVKSNLKLLWKLNSYYRKIKPDIIHHITLKPIVFGTIAARLNFSNASIVNAVSGLGYLFTEQRSPIARLLLFLLWGCESKRVHYIFQNRIDQKLFQKAGIAKQSIRIKGSGVDAKQFFQTAEPQSQTVCILFTGRILRDKGIVEFLTVAKAIVNKGFDVHFKIHGKLDPENPAHLPQEELESYLQKDRISWDGYTNEVHKVLNACHIFCLPSYREGLPKSIVEALAVGRPVVTTTAPGCDDCVVEGINGYKVPVKDHLLLEKKLIQLIENKGIREKMGAASRSFFEEGFTLKYVLKAHMELYKQLIDK